MDTESQNISVPIYKEKNTNESIMTILHTKSPLTPLSVEEKRTVARNMKCSLCSGIPPPLPKHCLFGHWMCTKCNAKVPVCPLEIMGPEGDVCCNQNVVHVWDMEKYTKIYNKQKIPCIHSRIGCTAIINAVNIKKHEKRCIFRRVNDVSAVMRVTYDKKCFPLLFTKQDTVPAFIHVFGKHLTLSVYQKAATFFMWLSFTSDVDRTGIHYSLEILKFKADRSSTVTVKRLLFEHLALPNRQKSASSIIAEQNCVNLSIGELGHLCEAKLKQDTSEYYFLVKVVLEASKK